ncbi:RHBDL2 [Cordylochernes scorpioides]|uniref:RHBDL2 n=1 Tax=Cordylochernes scorpioides TaxID=51811 RepID=A0ABY6K0W4_9ARAC|nr:RHBDL2 [Cordylochernes scorpioides]
MWQYAEEGQSRIPLQELQKLLPDLPAEVQVEVTHRLGQDSDGLISYSEFIDMVHSLKNDHPRLLRMLQYATAAVVPQSQRSSVVARYVSEYKCCPPPLFMPLISLIEIGVFIYYSTKLPAGQQVDVEGPLIYNPKCRVQAWRYLSYMLIHAG